MSQLTVYKWSDQQMLLMKNTVAKDCNTQEFDQFLHVANKVKLDPLRRQIYAFVFSKDNPNKRQMAIVTGIDGFRTVAARTGDYRADDKPPRIVYDETLKNETNPLGIVSAEVTVYKHAHGDWWPQTAIAYWDEFAPVDDEWAWNDEKGKRAPTGKKTLSGRWADMPRLMIAKCAEAQAIRRGWPDDLSNVYAQEETDLSQTLDLSPSEYAEQAAVQDRLALIGGKDAIMLDFDNGIESVPIGQVADRVMAHVNSIEPYEVAQFENVNRAPLKEFWARAKSDALEVKKVLESRIKLMESAQ